MTQEFLWINDFIKIISVQGFHITFLLFTISFLNLKSLPSLFIKLIYLFYIISFIAFLFLGLRNSFQSIAYIAGILIPLFWVFIGFIALHRNVIFAKLYLIGLFGFYIGVLLFWLMQLGLIDVPSLGKNVLLLGSTWEMIIFTCMLIFKTKLMKAENLVMKAHLLAVEKERMCQSRYASIGRTIGNIAHQWKQPLNALGTILTHMKCSFIVEQKVKKKELVQDVDMSFEIVQHLSETINTFYSFLLKPYAHTNKFSVEEELKSIKKILDYAFKNDGIQMSFYISSDAYIEGNSNEFAQCILNILFNAKDQFYGLVQENAHIDVYIDTAEEMCHISIQDNAGGITIYPIERIFEFNVSSKEESAGIGLFICKDIIESRFNGKIRAENKEGGACFIITLPIMYPKLD
ncbi:sensor histidine kinase [Sulfurospirillum diekertiae]|uniref:histidine kinase n=1 Tax=Sulfurospirillum diekertiae TaxID=1854492 RepID=A0A1Y0HLL4_9BACT|nr:HAMP domain-containing sensor histidine kinase [Sulfurospirillum diekertiae]ARU48264.1 Sensor histidine kinase TodS [Sulfurospirillum diekertiae]ASC93106.1 Sensor histidine kinase TodS [Sulfurospirillum diekertiae]